MLHSEIVRLQRAYEEREREMCDVNMDTSTDNMTRIYSSKDVALQLDRINNKDRSDMKKTFCELCTCRAMLMFVSC